METSKAGAGPVAARDPRDLDAITNYDVSSNDERYQSAFAGLYDTAVIPMGPGLGPNHLRVISDGHVHADSHVIEVPIIAHATIADGDLTISFIERVSPGSLNLPVTVARNDVFFVGPGVDHASVAMPGTRFDLTVLDIDAVRERADDMGLQLGDIDDPSISRLAPRPAMAELRRVLTDILQLPVGLTPPRWVFDELLTSATVALAEAWPERPRRARASMSSLVVVRRCLDHTQHLKRRPLMHELCRAAGVSERMVRRAFTDVFDLPPSTYFRLWALSRARQRLANAREEQDKVAGQDTVSEIAHEVGFGHLSRFAGQYRAVYEESPSETLRRRRKDGTPTGS